MSSSLGNFFTVSEAVEEFGPDVLRTFLLSTAYTSRATYSEETIGEAQERWDRLQRGYERAVEACDGVDAYATETHEDLRDAVSEARASFEGAMNDDFNTREAMTALLSLTGEVNAYVDDHDEYDYVALRRAVETFEAFGGGILGLGFGDEGEGGEVSLAGDLVELVLQAREDERAAGNYERADHLRDELEAIGVEVQDTDDGPTYRL